MLRRGRGRKCRLQFSLPRRYECVNCRIPLLGLRFAATSCRASHAYPCLFLLDTDTGNCRKTCPTIMHPPPLLHLPSAGGAPQNTPRVQIYQLKFCILCGFGGHHRDSDYVCLLSVHSKASQRQLSACWERIPASIHRQGSASPATVSTR